LSVVALRDTCYSISPFDTRRAFLLQKLNVSFDVPYD